MSNFTIYHNVFYTICLLKSFNSHISVVVCSFFEFRTVSKWRIREWVNRLPNVKNLDASKLKALPDYIINFAETFKFNLEIVENIIEKGENADYQHFLLFPQFFQNLSRISFFFISRFCLVKD